MLLFPDLPSLKLVEPGRDEGVVRVETMVRVSGVLGSGSGYRVPVVVSTQPFADAHVLAQSASRRRLGPLVSRGSAQPASRGDSGCSFPAVRLDQLGVVGLLRVYLNVVGTCNITTDASCWRLRVGLEIEF